MGVKEKVRELERKVEELMLTKGEVKRLTRNVEALIEYLCADTTKREPKTRPSNFPLNPDSGKRATSKIEKEGKLNKIKAKLVKLGCEFKEKKTNTQIFLNGKKLGVMKKSGRIERKITIDGQTGYRKTDPEKFFKIVKKRAKK